MFKHVFNTTLLALVCLFFTNACENFEFITPKKPESTPVVKKLRFTSFITNSSNTSCGITGDYKLFCTLNLDNQGLSYFEYTIPSQWPIKLVDSGRHHVCGIFTGPSFDEIWCKGTGTSGQLGDGTNFTSDNLVKVVGLPEERFIDLGLGGTRSCALSSERKVYCWGTGGMIGGVTSYTPFETTLTGVIELKGNFSSTCALKEDRTLWCWGTGSSGILGQGTLSSTSNPVKVKDPSGTGFLENISDFSVGHTQTCAIVDKEVYCWGYSRRVGVDADGYTTLPHHIPELSGAVRVESGDYHSCSLMDSGEVYCWGDNRNLQVGGGEEAVVVTPRKIDLGNIQVKDLSLGNGPNPSMARSCVLTVDGKTYCWGTAALGIFGTLTPLLAHSFHLQPDTNISSLKISSSSQCLIIDNKPYATGYNDYLQFDHDRYIVSSPELMSSDDVSDFNCSRYSNCYVSARELYCKGLNYTGRQKVTALGNNVVRAITGSHSTCALMNNDDLWCWGTNSSGQVGDGTTTATVDASTPYLTMTNVASAEGAGNFFCALKHDRTVWCWGANGSGNIGHNNPSESKVSLPVQVQGLPDLSQANLLQLKAEEASACLHVDQDIYCWGKDIGSLISLNEANTHMAHKLSALSGNIRKIAIISSGVCVSYADSRVSCLSTGKSSLSIFPMGDVHKTNFPPLKGEIQELDGGSYLLCALMRNGQRYCLGNNSTGGMNHSAIMPPQLMYPVDWRP